MWKKPMLTAAFVAISSFAQAQSDCVEIEDNAARLACFDETFARNDGGEMTPPGADLGKWSVDTAVDAMTDRSSFFISNLSREPTDCGSARATLMIQCTVNDLQILVLHGCFAPDRVRVNLRFDDGPVIQRIFSSDRTDTGYGAWETPSARRWLTELLSSEQFIMRFAPYRRTAETLIFDTSQLGEAIIHSGMPCGAELAAQNLLISGDSSDTE